MCGIIGGFQERVMKGSVRLCGRMKGIGKWSCGAKDAEQASQD